MRPRSRTLTPVSGRGRPPAATSPAESAMGVIFPGARLRMPGELTPIARYGAGSAVATESHHPKMTALMTRAEERTADPPRSRLARLRRGLSPAEWTRVGAMAATVIALNVVGWAMLAAALGG